jgi:citrate synthase
MPWLTAQQALGLLGTKSQTLYANVSRGRIRAKPDPSDTRRSLYLAEDVNRLAARQAGRRKTESVAADAIQWGDPMLPSAISTVSNGRLFYRGRDTAHLSATATLEDAAALLWNIKRPLRSAGNDASQSRPSIADALVLLAARAASDLPSLGRSMPTLQREAETVLATVAGALAPGVAQLPLHARLAISWDRPRAADAIRRALVLFADHELNTSTFAARVTASSGASLSAATLAGLAALTGPLHGGAWQGMRMLVESAEKVGAREAVRLYLAQGHALPAFGHPLYPHGDPRAAALIEHFPVPPIYAEVGDAVEDMVGERRNADFALSALAAAFDLPVDAPLVIFALARTVGWLAHAIEQATSGQLIRPRARYVGVPLENDG